MNGDSKEVDGLAPHWPIKDSGEKLFVSAGLPWGPLQALVRCLRRCKARAGSGLSSSPWSPGKSGGQVGGGGPGIQKGPLGAREIE